MRGEFTLDVVDEHGVGVIDEDVARCVLARWPHRRDVNDIWCDDERHIHSGTSGQWSLGCRSVGECRIAIDGEEVLVISPGDAGGSMFGHGSPERSVNIERYRSKRGDHC